jgi:single-stranded DNA-specific DHH superfamily exonuclease
MSKFKKDEWVRIPEFKGYIYGDTARVDTILPNGYYLLSSREQTEVWGRRFHESELRKTASELRRERLEGKYTDDDFLRGY